VTALTPRVPARCRSSNSQNVHGGKNQDRLSICQRPGSRVPGPKGLACRIRHGPGLDFVLTPGFSNPPQVGQLSHEITGSWSSRRGKPEAQLTTHACPFGPSPCPSLGPGACCSLQLDCPRIPTRTPLPCWLLATSHADQAARDINYLPLPSNGVHHSICQSNRTSCPPFAGFSTLKSRTKKQVCWFPRISIFVLRS
jgi:hypothetical protein